MKTRTFTIGPEPFPQDRMRDWLKAQINYENLAGDEEVAQRAVAYATAQVKRYEQATGEIFDKWETTDFLLRGNTLSTLFPGSDIHVPILYTMVETIVPRVVEAITSMKPWFEVEGRDKLDKARASKIQAYLRYEVDRTQLERRMEEIVRTLIAYQFVALKTHWNVEYDERIVRDVERSVTDRGLPEFKITPRKETVKVDEGNGFDIVNPYLWICDTTKTDVQKMAFCGDVSFMREDELARMVDLGVFDGDAVDEVVERGRKGSLNPGALNARARIQAQSLTPDPLGLTGGRERTRGEPGEFEVTEIWCRWRPEGADSKAPFKEWVLTTCGGKALRVQENFYDDKRRPYAVARAAKEPFSFFNVGILDHSIRLNMEVDDHRNLARLSHRLALCPYTQVDTNSDWPENLFDADPGQVFRGKEPPAFIKVPSTIGEMIPFEQVLRTDMERATGSPSIFEGVGQSNTATESERKTIEGNRRMRRLVFALADGLEDLLGHFHRNTQQFLTTQKAFRVLNGQGTGLLDYELSPDDLADPVDIVISGPERLSSYGLRATQMSSWMQQFGVLLPALQAEGRVNLPLLAKIGWERTMGEDLGEEVISVPERADEAVPPEDENLVFLMGQTVPVHEADDDTDHARQHELAAALAKADGDLETERRIRQHIQLHRIQQQRKASRAALAGAPPQGPFPAGAGIASRHAPAEGRGYQPTPDLMGDVPGGTPPRETPGPQRPASTGSPDRAPAAAQTANRR